MIAYSKQQQNNANEDISHVNVTTYLPEIKQVDDLVSSTVTSNLEYPKKSMIYSSQFPPETTQADNSMITCSHSLAELNSNRVIQ